MTLVLRLLAGVGGVVALYIAAASVYETSERRLQSQIEDFWLTLATASDRALPAHTLVLQFVADRVARMLTVVFGDRIPSIRFFLVSVLLAYATAGAFSTLDAFVYHTQPLWMSLLGLAFTTIVAALALRGSDSRLWMVSAAITTAFLLAFQLSDINAPIYVLIILWAVGANAVAIGSSRWLLRRASSQASSISIVAALCLTVAFAVIVVGAPDVFFMTLSGKTFEQVNDPESWESGFIGLAFAMTAIATLPPLAFVVLLASVLLHRALWSVVLRPLYLLQRTGLAKSRKLLLLLGVFLLLGALRPTYLTPRRLMQTIGARFLSPNVPRQ